MYSLFSLPRSVYILGDGLLFDEVIAKMLVSTTDMRVIKRVYGEADVILVDLHGSSRDVILLNETDQFTCDQLLVLLSRIKLTTDLRIIVLSLMHQDIQILDLPSRTRPMISRVSKGIDDWQELLELIAGKQLL